MQTLEATAVIQDVSVIQGANHSTVPASPFVTEDLPAGYDTVLGYYAKKFPHTLEEIEEPFSALRFDAFRLTQMAHVRGIELYEVEPAPYAKAMGVTKVLAYPHSLLSELLR